jgi:hypothetical protein
MDKTLMKLKKKLIIIGPGTLPIPIIGENGWGGIENILTSIMQELDARGIDYTLINDKDNYLEKVELEVAKNDCIIHCHYDDYAPLLKQKFGGKVPIIATSHSPFHSFRQTWNSGVENHFKTLFNHIDGYFGQGVEANNIAKEMNPSLKIGTCRCCVSEEKFIQNRVLQGNGRTLMLGKIEPRKNQAPIRNNFSDLPIDFVGAIADGNFIDKEVYGNTRYLGCWSRNQVWSNLPKYSSLMCVSNFEGDVVVVKEAIASGCNLILSPFSSININKDWSFVKILNEKTSAEDFRNIIRDSNSTNFLNRDKIYEIFDSNFSKRVVVDQYISDLKEVFDA